MASTTKVTTAQPTVKKNDSSLTLSGWFTKKAEAFDKGRFVWSTLLLTLQSCLGSVACMYIFKSNAGDTALSLSAIITMVANSVFLAQAPAKWCLAITYFSMLLNLVIILLTI